MTMLVVGVVLWSLAHLGPVLRLPLRQRIIDRIGEQPYKGLFSLVILGSMVLMVLGWRSSQPVFVYGPPAWSLRAAELLMFVALFLFVASGVPSNVKRVVRHPQLTGVIVWSLAHLISNGDRRSLVLFGGLGLWAVVSIALINRRDGAWQKPEPTAVTAALKPLVVAAVAYVALFFAHPYISGVALPRPW